MAAVQPNPIRLTHAIKLPPPSHARTLSRSKSPAKSPARKAEFAARELDPLLQNLSPDSTLEALQETNAIRGNRAEQNAIARSISDASEAERELGIRAAVAAKKLKEWTDEVSAWSWPSSEDRAWGAGFVTPASDSGEGTQFWGSLPKETVRLYEDRLDEIWDAIDTLSIAELKDYVFSSHQPSTRSASGQTTAYGRMRDFTALITATVIQALPVLATLHVLLETWSIRLTLLRQIPDLLADLEKIKLGLNAIHSIVKDEDKSRKLTKPELETAKDMFGSRVSNLGKRIDKMLDLLEGQEDSLPQTWIDSLEDIENGYASWVVQAEQIVLRNQTMTHPSQDRGSTTLDSPAEMSWPTSAGVSSADREQINEQDAAPESRSPQASASSIKRKPLLGSSQGVDSGHKRGVSEVSMADSALSGYSFENAEIIDAQATPLLPSPRISGVDCPLPPTKTSTSWFAPKQQKEQILSSTRPSTLQRASTALAEHISQPQLQEGVLRRSPSHDLLASQKSNSNNFEGAHDLPKTAHPVVTLPQRESYDPIIKLPPNLTSIPPAASLSPSLRIDQLRFKRGAPADQSHQPPLVPRRSSKRASMPLLNLTPRPSTPPQRRIKRQQANVGRVIPVTPPSNVRQEETFDDRLKTILASMPTKIRLTKGSDSSSSDRSSEASSRVSSPLPTLKLSPVRNTKSGNSNPAQSGIRVYHLKGGKSRDAPPLKLYVRAVGEFGERVMVRVGGGWADLAEYLREYSLHHGGRGLAEGKLEVVEFPASGQSQSPSTTSRPAVAPTAAMNESLQFNFDFGLDDKKVTDQDKDREVSPWRPPPVPLVPHAMVGQARTTSPFRDRRAATPTPSNRPLSRISTTMTVIPAATTTSSSNNTYTPLGGAGPVHNNRRTISQTFARTSSNDAGGGGMVNQARAVSSGHLWPHHPHTAGAVDPSSKTGSSTTVISPTTTTTTSITSSKTGKPGNTPRRVSSWTTMPTQRPGSKASNRPTATSSPHGSQISQSSGTSNGRADAIDRHTGKRDTERRKSRMSLGDVSGIRRVFLKKRSNN